MQVGTTITSSIAITENQWLRKKKKRKKTHKAIEKKNDGIFQELMILNVEYIQVKSYCT